MLDSTKIRIGLIGFLTLAAFDLVMAQKTQTKLIEEGLDFPEGPAFDQANNLWLVELKGGNLVRISDGKLERFATDGNPNGIAIDPNGLIWFCDAGQKSIRTYDPIIGVFETKATQVNDEELSMPNDLVFDSKGSLLFTCPGDSRKEPTGYVCALNKDGTVKKIADQMYFPNGLAFTNDGKSLIIAETYKHRLWKGEWDADKAEWREAKIWCEIGGPDGPGGPDGMAFDSNGNLYVAVYGTGQVRVVNTEGEVIDTLFMSGSNPTNCAFDPKNPKRLVITEAENGELVGVHLSTEEGKQFQI